MTADATIWFVVVDEKGEQSTIELPVDIVAVGDLPIVVASAAAILQPLLWGGLVRAGFTAQVDIDGGVWASAATSGSDVQEKAYFAFRTAGSYVKSLTLPTFREGFIQAGTKLVNTGSAAVVAFVTMMEDGITGIPGNTVRFADYRGDLIDYLTEARDAWGKYRRG